MNLSSRNLVFAVLSSLLLIHTAATAQDPPGDPPSDAKQKEEIVFPEVEGWTKGEIVTYPRSELGYSLPYQSRTGGTVTIFVYNGGHKSIPNDLSDGILKDEMDRAKSDIHKAGELGHYEGVKEIKDETVTLGGKSGNVRSLRSHFEFNLQGMEVTSEIYLFSFNNKFVKIRATRLREAEEAKNPALEKLLSEIDALFRRRSAEQ